MQQKHLPPLLPSLLPTLFPLPPCSRPASLSLSFSSVEFKKSYENDSQSSDNVNFLRVGWSNKQLTTLKPLLSEIEYLQDQHLLLTVKSLDGYESYGRKRMFVVWLRNSLKLYLLYSFSHTTNVCVCFPPARRVCVGSEVNDWQHISAVPHLPVPPRRGNGKYQGVHEGQGPR